MGRREEFVKWMYEMRWCDFLKLICEEDEGEEHAAGDREPASSSAAMEV